MIINVENEKSVGQRIDSFLSQIFDNFSRSLIKKAINQALVRVNNKIIYKVQIGDKISFKPPVDKKSALVSEDIPLNVVYEDKKVLVINKNAGMVMHPAVGNWSGTLANVVLGYLRKTKAPRGGIVHRLVKDTSGLVIVAKDIQTLEFLQKQFREKTVEKKYHA